MHRWLIYVKWSQTFEPRCIQAFSPFRNTTLSTGCIKQNVTLLNILLWFQFKRFHKNKYTTRKVGSDLSMRMIWQQCLIWRHEQKWRKTCRFCTTSIEHAWENLFNDCSMRSAQNDLIIAQMWTHESVIITCFTPLTLTCQHATQSPSYELVSVLSYGMF